MTVMYRVPPTEPLTLGGAVPAGVALRLAVVAVCRVVDPVDFPGVDVAERVDAPAGVVGAVDTVGMAVLTVDGAAAVEDWLAGAGEPFVGMDVIGYMVPLGFGVASGVVGAAAGGAEQPTNSVVPMIRLTNPERLRMSCPSPGPPAECS